MASCLCNVTLVWLPVLVLVATIGSAQVPLSTTVAKSPNLNLILQRMEDVEHGDAAQSRTYDVTREYKMFHGAETRPASEVTAQVDFVPPDTVRYKITQTRGSSRGEQIVRYLLDLLETGSAKKGRGSEISRANYDFVFLRQDDIGVIPSTFWESFPSGKIIFLRGQIWVEASTFHIRRIEGIPARVLLYGLRAFTSPCNLDRLAVCGCRFPSTRLVQCASWDSSHSMDSMSDPRRRKLLCRSS